MGKRNQFLQNLVIGVTFFANSQSAGISIGLYFQPDRYGT